MKRDSWEWWLFFGLLAILAYTAGAAVQEVTMNASQNVIDEFSQAIANAEGFFVQGSRPQQNNNPGDLERDITGTGVGFDGPYVKYGTVEDGWAALKHLVGLMFSGGSHFYNSGMTIAEVGAIYAAGDPNWSINVASYLGVSVNTRLMDLTA